MTTGYFTHPLCEQHDMGADHPESPKRLLAINNTLQATGLRQDLIGLTAQPAQMADLSTAHNQHSIDLVHNTSPQSGIASIDGDTSMNAFSLDAALLAAGAGIAATKAVLSGELNNAFCAVRPPGHHAEHNLPMGFCLFNNIAIAALYALQQDGIERVAILDFDVHHGNGTVDIFAKDPRVLVCSSYQHPHYPMRHHDTYAEHLVHCPLAAGSGSREFRHAIERKWLDALQWHKPDMIFISAGFDAHHMDPLADLNLHADDYAWITGLIMDQARCHAQGRLVSMLEGGYHLQALAASVQQHIQTLRGV
ncbi:MAG: histone deacetylase family protein [Gammaproteobacteria bacterium]|jgi:acetoin utilization deacetylase AcuC-like enzyme|nr:histone deacetylase family protein [Gammaproteobacteria bacterium]